MVFLRNPQLRYTKAMKGGNTFAIAIEHPGNDVDPGQLRHDRSHDRRRHVAQHGARPDRAVPPQKDWGHVQVAGIAAQLGYETLGAPDNSSEGRQDRPAAPTSR